MSNLDDLVGHIETAQAALVWADERIKELSAALNEVLDFVDRDIILIRPSERDEFLSGLERWNIAAANARKAAREGE